MDSVLVQRMLESVSNAVSSLLSLVQLLDEVKNMVISDHIQTEVWDFLVYEEARFFSVRTAHAVIVCDSFW